MSKNDHEDHEPKTMKPEDIVAMKRLGGGAISPDDKWVAFVRSIPIVEEDNIKYRGHIWLVPTEGGEPFQLTNS